MVWFVFHFICFPSNYIPPKCNVLYIDNKVTKYTDTMYTLFIFHIHGYPMFIVSSGVLRVYEQHGGYRIFGGSVLLFVLVFCVVLCLVVLFVFILCLVCPKMPVPLDCPFLISTSVFYNVYCRAKLLLLPFNILLYCKLNPLIAWKSYFTIVGIRPQTLKGSIWPKVFFIAILGWCQP